VNGFQDVLRPILLAVSCNVLDDIAFNKRDAVLEDELGGLDRHVVMLSTFLSV
jgi:hypothetical protein|tara:strand:- start:533 stop:691 length:159 start_codon:yes stop_codon:yes gene_type:complete